MTNKIKSIHIVASFLLFSIGFIVYNLSLLDVYSNIISISMIFIGLFDILYIYLQGGFSSQKNGNSEVNISAGEGAKVSVYQNIERFDGVNPESIKELFSEDFDKGIFIDLLDYMQKHSNRIKEYINNLSRNGNVNLIIGLATTLIAVYMLIFQIISKDANYSNYFELIAYYIPRFSIMLFIELFALFFLNLYRIKYFQNELTNIESKIISLKTSLYSKDNELIKMSIEKLLNTERNFIIKKGESTIELEKNKIESYDIKSLVKNLSGIINNGSVKNETKEDSKS